MCRKQDKPLRNSVHLQETLCLCVICCTFCKDDKTAVKPNKSLYSTQLMFILNQRIRGIDRPNFDSFKCSETHTLSAQKILSKCSLFLRDASGLYPLLISLIKSTPFTKQKTSIKRGRWATGGVLSLSHKWNTTEAASQYQEKVQNVFVNSVYHQVTITTTMLCEAVQAHNDEAIMLMFSRYSQYKVHLRLRRIFLS